MRYGVPSTRELRGGQNAARIPEIPRDFNLNDVLVQRKTAIVDMSRSFENGHSQARCRVYDVLAGAIPAARLCGGAGATHILR